MTGIYSNRSVNWNSGMWSYNGGQMADPALVPNFQPTADTRTNTLVADLMTLFKAHARIPWADDDAIITLYLTAAISRIEQYCMLPIMPAAYTWSMPATLASAYDGFELPLRNANVKAGGTVEFLPSFEAAIAPGVVKKVTAWPLIIEVGYTAGIGMPADLQLSVFSLALSMYESRSNPEMSGFYSLEAIAGLSRYWIPRV